MNEPGSNNEQFTAVDGVPIERIERPPTIEALSSTLADANEREQVVVPVGGGTLLALGNLLKSSPIAVSTRAINRVLAYEPADLTLSVEAGATLAEINQRLGEQGQWLPIEAPFPERSTIGGLIATAFAGPRRLGSETIRDLIVGISVAHANGTVTKAGGTVVKNVTGFDMMRLYHGALGTLGGIVSANFKVLPRPRTERTLLASYADLDQALSASRAILQSRARPVALDIVSRNGAESWTLAARFEGRAGTVSVMETEATSFLSGAQSDVVIDAESASWWQTELNRWNEPSSRAIRVRLTSRPRLVDALAKNVLAHFEISPPRAVSIAPGLGRVDFEFDLDISGEDRDELFRLLYQGADNVSVSLSPSEFKQGIDVWGREPETIDVMRSLKEEFDPSHILNRGRFAGFI
ncbi:FAD-binding oxidoreductase [soil metagenome]